MWEENQNIVQFSRPAPLQTSSIESAVDLVFNQFILDQPIPYVHQFKNRTVAVKALRQAYKNSMLLQKGVNLKEYVTVTGNNHEEQFDFALVNGEAIQLSHAFSFQLINIMKLSKNIRAWSWTVGDLRKSGGQININNQGIRVPKNVDIQVVIIPPREERKEDEERVFKEAKNAFVDNRVNYVELEKVELVVDNAFGLLNI